MQSFSHPIFHCLVSGVRVLFTGLLFSMICAIDSMEDGVGLVEQDCRSGVVSPDCNGDFAFVWWGIHRNGEMVSGGFY